MRSRLSFIAVFTILASGLLLALWMLADARQAAWKETATTDQNLAEILSHDIGRAIQSYDLNLQTIQTALRQPNLRDLPLQEKLASLPGQVPTAQYFGTLLVTDAQGKVITTGLGPIANGMTVANRDYFRAQQSAAEDKLFIGHPIRSHISDQNVIGISRRLSNRDGSFAGVVAGAMRLSYFYDLLSRVQLPRGTTLLILLADGTVLNRFPDDGSSVGVSLAGSPAFAHMNGKPDAFTAISLLDKVQKLYTYRQVEGLPLIVTVGTPLKTVYAEWWQRALVVALVGLPLLIAALLLGHALSQELDRRSHAEQEAQQRGAEFRTTFDASADGLFLLRVQPSGRFVLERANAALTRLWSLPVGAMEGREPRSFLSAALVARMEQHWVACLQSGEPERYSLSVDQGDRRAELETVVTPIRNDTGDIALLLGSTRDVTERMEMAEQLANAQKLEAVAQISTGVTHDFNNVLQALTIGMREMMAQLPETDMRRRLGSTLQSVERGVELTRRLLAFSRQKKSTPQTLHVAHLISESRELLAWALGPTIALETVAISTLWTVHVDKTQLEMCLLNLAANARDAMPNGGKLLIRARNASAREAAQIGLSIGDAVVISVQDSGCGMDASTRARVFDAFFTTKRSERGSGLGLWMVRGFARNAGGDVRIDSENGKGTQVSIWLPRVVADITAEASTPPALLPASTTPALPAPTTPALEPVLTGPPRDEAKPGHRILLVDDDQLVLSALARLLAEAGHDVTATGDGDAALQLLTGPETFDLMIADQSVPGLSGTELVAESARHRPNLPTMLITGYASLEQIPAGVRVLHKPIDADALLAEVAALISPAEILGA